MTKDEFMKRRIELQKRLGTKRIGTEKGGPALLHVASITAEEWQKWHADFNSLYDEFRKDNESNR